MEEIFREISQNKILLTTISAWLIAQTIKVVLAFIREKKLDFRWFVGSGGMPSSHASGAACLSTAVGIEYGFGSVYFALAAAFAIVVMFDAQGVRRAAGRQASLLNRIMDDIYWQGKVKETRLRELVGHTPVEVFMGFLLGVLIAFVAG